MRTSCSVWVDRGDEVDIVELFRVPGAEAAGRASDCSTRRLVLGRRRHADFVAGCGDQAQSALQVLCSDGVMLLAGGFDPCRASQQVDRARDSVGSRSDHLDGRRLETGTLQPGLLEAMNEIRLHLGRLQRG